MSSSHDADTVRAAVTDDRRSQGEHLEEIADFLSHVEAFETLSGDQLARLAAAVTHRQLVAGDHDPLCPSENGRLLSASWPASQLNRFKRVALSP